MATVLRDSRPKCSRCGGPCGTWSTRTCDTLKCANCSPVRKFWEKKPRKKAKKAPPIQLTPEEQAKQDRFSAEFAIRMTRGPIFEWIGNESREVFPELDEVRIETPTIRVEVQLRLPNLAVEMPTEEPADTIASEPARAVLATPRGSRSP